MMDGPLAQSLRRQRDVLNARFAIAERQMTIDRDVFSDALMHVAKPLFDGLHPADDKLFDRCSTVVFDAVLRLTGLGYFAHHGELADELAQLFQACAELLARAPRRTVTSLIHALLRVKQQNPRQCRLWVEKFAACAGTATTVDQLRDLAVVLAWRSGLAQYRTPALARLDHLKTASTKIIFDQSCESSEDYISKLTAHPWPPQQVSRCVAAIGGYSGLAGTFRDMPGISVLDDSVIISSGDGHWRLYADRFGHFLEPVPQAGNTASHTRIPASYRKALEPMQPLTGLVKTDGFLAAVSSLSYQVFIVV